MPNSEASGEILVVDDNPDTLQLLSEMLSAAGYVSRAAPSGEMALWSASRRLPDLVVMDVRMPGMNGFETCRCLKRQPATAGVPVIFLSASADPDDRIEGFDAGGVDFVSKPFVESEVLARIRTHMRMALSAKRLLYRRQAATLSETEGITATGEQPPDQEILIVEDTPASLQLLSAVLSGAGYSVREAPNGELALWTASKRPPSLILLDIRMPGMNGFDVCRCLKLDPVTAQIPVIFISALSDSEDKAEGFAVGAVDFITKPFAENEVLARVKTHLRLAAEAKARTQLADADGLVANAQARLPALAEVFSGSASALALLDAEGRILHANGAFVRLCGCQQTADDGHQSLSELFDGGTEAHASVPWAAFSQHGYWTGELLLRTPSGSRRHCQLSLSKLADPGRTEACCIAVAHDLSQKPAAESVADYLTRYDPRTGLPSRTLAAQSFAAQSKDGATATILVVSIGGAMQGLAATPGESALTLLRQQLVERIASVLHGGDMLYREDEEHFVVIHSAGDASDQSVALAEQILQQLGSTVDVQEKTLGIAPRIAIAFHPADGTALDRLLDRALGALEQTAKEDAPPRVVLAGTSTQASEEAISLDIRLRGALERGEIELLYQPVFDLHSSRMLAAEALLRWNAPQIGTLLPDEFLELANATGEILPIGVWALEQACVQARYWQEDTPHDFYVVINLSSLQFWQDGLVDGIAAALQRHQLPPASLEFDISAETLLEDFDQGIAILRHLETLGVRLALDNYVAKTDTHDLLRRLPLDCLKLDARLTAEAENDPVALAEVRMLVDHAHHYLVAVLDKEVDSAQHLALLQDCGVDRVMGYWLGPPVPAAELRIAAPLRHG